MNHVLEQRGKDLMAMGKIDSMEQLRKVLKSLKD